MAYTLYALVSNKLIDLYTKFLNDLGSLRLLVLDTEMYESYTAGNTITNFHKLYNNQLNAKTKRQDEHRSK